MQQLFLFATFELLLETVLLPRWEADDDEHIDPRPEEPAAEPGFDDSPVHPVFLKKLLPALLAAACFVLAPMAAGGQTWFNGQLWYPKPAPAFEPAKNKSPLLVNRLVRFDPKTRTEEVLQESASDFFGASYSESSPGVLPAFDNSAELESLTKSFSPLESVADPTAEPARWNVKIFIKQGGNNWVCSGSLIDSRHVLTAGHCLFDEGWADSVFVVPAFYEDAQGNGIAPYGAATDVNLLSWTGWTQQHDYEWDMGVIFLERPVGALTGWFGFGSSEDYQFYKDNLWRNFSYPAQSPYDGNDMFFRTAGMSYHYESQTIFNPEPSFWDSLYVYHFDASLDGQFGSSYYTFVWFDRIIYAVLSHTNVSSTGDDFTGIAHIHHGQFNQISDFFDENIPAQLDLIPLWTTTSTKNAAPGEMLADFSFIIHNYSKPTFSGGLEAKVFLSADRYYSAEDDVLISTLSMPNLFLPERGTTIVTIEGDQPHIPNTIPAGDYYLGVVLDLADVNEGNNATKLWDVEKITVSGCPKLTFFTKNRFDSDWRPLSKTPDNQCNAPIVKVCADGSAQVSKLELSGFSLPSEYQLRLRQDPDGQNPAVFGKLTLLSADDEKIEYAYAHPDGVYEAGGSPSNATFKEYHFEVVAVSTGSVVATLPFHLYRAPVVMMHGLWANGADTFSEMKFELADGLWNNDLTYPHSYPNDVHFASNSGEAFEAVQIAIQNAAGKGYSVGRVNLVCHSMGGLVSRIFIQSNAFQNDIVRFITCNTPHSGSQGANLIQELLEAYPFLGDHFLRMDKNPYNGAVEDLQVNSNAYWGNGGLNYGSGNGVPSHAVITTSSVGQVFGEWADWWLELLVHFLGLTQATQALDEFLVNDLYEDAHDLVVAQASQRGNCPKWSLIQNQWHVGSTANSQVINRVEELLNAHLEEEFSTFGFFSPPLLFYNYVFQPGIAVPGSVEFISPPSGSIVTPGGLVDVSLTGSPDVGKHLFTMGGSGTDPYAEVSIGQSADFTIHIPDDFLGVLNLDAFGFTADNVPGFDAAGNGGDYVGMDSIHLIVLPDASLDSLSMQPDTVFVPMGGTASVAVSAHFNNGMSGLATLVPGLVFEVSDSSLLEFTAPGILKGLLAGTAQATAAWQGQTASTTVIVLPVPVDAFLEVPTPLEALPCGGTFPLQVSTNQPWQMTVQVGGDWLSAQNQAGIGNGIVMLFCQPNPGMIARQAVISVNAGGLSKTIVVTQVGAQLNVTPDTVQVSSSAGSLTANLNTNLDWTATSNAAWLTPGPATGTDNATITLSFLPNFSTTPRQATISVETGCGLEQITVIQAGQAAFLSAGPDTLHFPHTADTLLVFIFSNMPWSVSDLPGWVSVTPSSGFGFDTLTVICQPNPSSQLRFDTIEIVAGGLHQNIFVYQKKKVILPNPPVPTPVPGNPAMLNALNDEGNETPVEWEKKQPHFKGFPASPMPDEVSISVFPNPVKNAALIAFTLPSEQAIQLEISDFSGRQVAVLATGEFPAGKHEVTWASQGLPPGVYCCRLTVEGRSVVVRIVLH